jgi:hypothetical protein
MSRRRTRSLAEIAPDGFLDYYDAETFEEGLRKAERSSSTTPEEEMKRCPVCKSRRWTPKPGGSQRHRVPGDYICTQCRETFDNPLPPESAVAAEITVTLRLQEESGLCCACGDDARIYVYDGGVGVGGAVCFEHVGDLLASAVAEEVSAE